MSLNTISHDTDSDFFDRCLSDRRAALAGRGGGKSAQLIGVL